MLGVVFLMIAAAFFGLGFAAGRADRVLEADRAEDE